jgi:hypothetical protein
MIYMNINTLKAGREMDKLVIEKVMQMEYRESSIGKNEIIWVCFPGQEAVIFHPSSNIQDAWIVANKYDYFIIEKRTGYGPDRHLCQLDSNEEDGTYTTNYAEADSTPLAICLAALKSVMEESK